VKSISDTVNGVPAYDEKLQSDPMKIAKEF